MPGAVSDPDSICMMARTLSELLKRDVDELNRLLEDKPELHREIRTLQVTVHNALPNDC